MIVANDDNARTGRTRRRRGIGNFKCVPNIIAEARFEGLLGHNVSRKVLEELNAETH